MNLDPRDPAAVASALATWASEHFGGPVTVAGEPRNIAGGFDSFIHAVDLTGEPLPLEWRGPLVVRLLPSASRAPQAAREAAVQGWAAERGYTAPRALAVLGVDDGFDLPTQVMERAPGTTMLEAVSAKPWRVRRLVDQLAALALRLHALPTDGFPSDAATVVDHRLSLPRRVVAQLDRPDLAAALRRAEELAPQALDGPPVVCHGDFHPLNVMVDGDRASVIDWTDAGLGPRETDVARTSLIFHIAAIAANGAVERAVLKRAGPHLSRRYLKTYEAGVQLDPARMRLWEVLHGVHGWAQVEMLHAGGFDGSSSAEPGQIPLSVRDFLRARVQRALATR
ncbi:MAG: aminoglycoside phosphotransferase family protein [Acidimicrobiales bacterium]